PPAEGPRDQDVRREAPDDEDAEPDDVLRRPGREDAEVLALAAREHAGGALGRLELGLFFLEGPVGVSSPVPLHPPPFAHGPSHRGSVRMRPPTEPFRGTARTPWRIDRKEFP